MRRGTNRAADAAPVHHRMTRLLPLVAGVLALAVAPAWTLRETVEAAVCGCATGPLIDAEGNLDPSHCNAPRVVEILDRYADRSARLLPERVEASDFEAAGRKLETLRQEAAGELLAWMTRDELERFLPMLVSPDPPRPGTELRPGNWPGARLLQCDQAVYWINESLDRIADLDAVLLSLQLEFNMYGNDPGLFCDPQLVVNSISYSGAMSLYGQARGWLQNAADAMSQEAPGLAALYASLGWWRSVQAGLGFIVAYNSPPLSGDDRCTEVGDAGIALGAVAQAARTGYERAELCAQGAVFF